jgi:hypothetical protein
LGNQLIENVDIMKLAVADLDETGDIAAQIEQRVHFDRGLGHSKRRSRKQRQAQVDGRGVQSVRRMVQIDTEGFVDIWRENPIRRWAKSA